MSDVILIRALQGVYIVSAIVLVSMALLTLLGKDNWLDVEIKLSWLTSWFAEYFNWSVINDASREQQLRVNRRAFWNSFMNTEDSFVTATEAEEFINYPAPLLHSGDFEGFSEQRARLERAFSNASNSVPSISTHDHQDGTSGAVITSEDLTGMLTLPASYAPTRFYQGGSTLSRYSVRRTYTNGLGESVTDMNTFSNLRDVVRRVYIWNTERQQVEINLEDGFGWQTVSVPRYEGEWDESREWTIDEVRAEFNLMVTLRLAGNTSEVGIRGLDRAAEFTGTFVLNDIDTDLLQSFMRDAENRVDALFRPRGPARPLNGPDRWVTKKDRWSVNYNGYSLLSNLPNRPHIESLLNNATDESRAGLTRLIEKASCEQNAIARLEAWIESEEEIQAEKPRGRRITILPKKTEQSQ